MSDPLSVTASIVGITTAALQSVQFLVQTIDNVKGAPDILRAVTTDLRVIQLVLQSLIGSGQDASSQIVLSEQIKHAVENCEKACGAFRSQVEYWMEHSTQDKMFWIDRWKVGSFGLQRIKTFRGQLSDCKGTLSIALSTATVITTSRQEYLMQQLKDMMLRQNEAVIQQNIAQAGVETRAIELSMQRGSNRGEREDPSDPLVVHYQGPDRFYSFAENEKMWDYVMKNVKAAGSNKPGVKQPEVKE